MTVLECRQVTRRFGAGRRRAVALDDCSFNAETGEILGVVGPNGAGKTTLLRLIAGEIPASSGDLLVAGHRAGTAAARWEVGYAGDPPLAPLELSGTEWLSYLASHRASSAQERTRLVTSVVDLAELDAFAGRRIVAYSRGMMQRLALAAATIGAGSVLLLDETLSGIDPLVQRRLRHQVAAFAATRKLVIIASHDLATIERVATRVLVLVRGRPAADVATSRLIGERVAELTLTGSALVAVDRLLARFPGAVRTGQGMAVPLLGGLSVEQVLAACHQDRVPIAASRIRYRALEDILVRVAREESAA
jgi:ABC-2 type transport system ATP-binding protein